MMDAVKMAAKAKPPRYYVRVAAMLLVLAAASAPFARSQKPDNQQPSSAQTTAQKAQPVETAENKPGAKAAAPADPAQAKLLADAQKLLKLSEELKTEVDASSKDTLSLGVVKKAEEVEKLARSIKERLKKSN